MCTPEIAVMTGSDGRTTSFEEPGTIVIFRQVEGIWQHERMLPFSFANETSLAGLRRKMTGLVLFLGTCRIVVAKSATGAVYFELEKARCSIWEVTGAPMDFLDSVWRETTQETGISVPSTPVTTIPGPIETSPGMFTISIKDIQGKRPEVSSKQVLQQFIRRGGFTELEIICDHPPPWIEVEAERLGILIETGYASRSEVCMVLKKSSGSGCC